MAELIDSGARREFDTGAVRDIAEGKGRCDLLPLYIVSSFISTHGNTDGVLVCIADYMKTGRTDCILGALNTFRNALCADKYTIMLEVAKQYEDGARKYADRNWEKGMPVHCFIDSGIRHYLKFLRGDKDEPHDRAFIWNMLGAIWMHQNHPELIDLPFVEKQ